MDCKQFYIDGAWVDPIEATTVDVINPATEKPAGTVALGSAADAEKAILAAKRAFKTFSKTTVAERLEYLKAINAELIRRNDEIADAISLEMGAPRGLSRNAQAPSGPQHFGAVIDVLEKFEFEETMGTTKVLKEPIGVCALITPWNWPMNQIATKVAPAIAAGCTMVLKPSEITPFDAAILAEICHSVGLPAGVFNLVHGAGDTVGNMLTSHPDVAMVSFTGSTRAGVMISKNAAPTVKRVALELGGKSANIILEGVDLEKAIAVSVKSVMSNSGQSCNAPTRLMVPAALYDDVRAIAEKAAKSVKVGAPESDAHIGPVASKMQFDKIRGYIKTGIDEGADLIAGGTDMPEGLDTGYFIRPTVFGKVSPDMTIAREEIFGPVLSIMTYETVEEAIDMANDSEYGLSGYVWGVDKAAAYAVAAELRTGMVHINGASLDSAAPFGGYKASGNGREWGIYGLEEFLETKSVYGGAA
ncbi:aldehyde dehydrogenase family protein [Kordiimonas pumila]|uniref:Aldehyde dehydrogenase family protein n=1 Tax=Kordiimonas pumila TaxID=2161677 RepID=A0ABV7D493_9PROT|nr:aldehyde dehydrogenase family protein [Kordiimonas pumila]